MYKNLIFGTLIVFLLAVILDVFNIFQNVPLGVYLFLWALTGIFAALHETQKASDMLAEVRKLKNRIPLIIKESITENTRGIKDNIDQSVQLRELISWATEERVDALDLQKKLYRRAHRADEALEKLEQKLAEYKSNLATITEENENEEE